VAARGHIALRGLAGGDVHDGAEEVCFAMLTAEVLARGKTYVVSLGQLSGKESSRITKGAGEERKGGEGRGKERGGRTYSGDDIFMVAQVRFAVLTSVDDGPVQVLVVCEPHLIFLSCCPLTYLPERRSSCVGDTKTMLAAVYDF